MPDLSGEADDVAEIIALWDAGKFTLVVPSSVRRELQHPNTPAYVKQIALRVIYTLDVTPTEMEVQMIERMKRIIQGNARPGRHDQDATHLVEASKYGRYFITKDARLLAKADIVRDVIPLHISQA
jgi:hypothetical protein